MPRGDVLNNRAHISVLDLDRDSRRPRHVASQTGRAFVEIRELLLRGEFARGERIAELALVARLGASRTPIRLALERLAHIGLLDVVPTGGFAVREFTLVEVLDAIEVRGVLEGTAARLAAERLDRSSDVDGLRRLCTRMESLQRLTIESFAEYMDLNESFHSGVVELSRSVTLQRNLQQVTSLPFASPSAMVFPTSILPKSDETLATAFVHHRGIVEAIGRRQGTRAESLAREHAYTARGVLELAMSDTEALRGVPGGPLINVSLR